MLRLDKWELRRDRETNWQPIPVPGCWEETRGTKTDPGPFWYRTNFRVPETFLGKRTWIQFGAVSYSCQIYVNGHLAGNHQGMWDSFTIEITTWLQPGETTEILVLIEKPASLSAGPDSPHLPGNFPLRETLSGFLPYVWGHAFGGIWQAVHLYTTGERIIEDLWIHGTSDGLAIAEIQVSSAGPLHIRLHDPENQLVWEQMINIHHREKIMMDIKHARLWSLQSPDLYTAEISLPGSDLKTIRFGFRSLEAKGKIFNLNNTPIYPRMILSWGWYPDRLIPDPGPERVRADMIRLRDLGFNGIKLCLWFPPSYYFELADEVGMLLWVELPMWIPLPNQDFARQTAQEYARLVQQARQHPSVILYTLGCEIGDKIDSDLLGQLYSQIKSLTAGALVRDNSGSAEAYGGALNEHADFDDNHFYCELQFMQPTLNAFSAGWREKKPWLMGEFCDYDTFPDVTPHWWNNPDPAINPQGARWETRNLSHSERMQLHHINNQLSELSAASHFQGLVHRKYTLETIRARDDLSGYVITGEIDTPVSSAGLWDIHGRSKYDYHTFSSFNQDIVLALGWDRRRTWVAGGDRPSYRDHYNYFSGTPVRLHLVGSNFSNQRGKAHVTWDVTFPGQQPIYLDEIDTSVTFNTGSVKGLSVIEFIAPAVLSPCQAVLQATVTVGSQESTNRWPIWFYPRIPWEEMPFFGLFDPLNYLVNLSPITNNRCCQSLKNIPVAVCCGWGDEVDQFIYRGGKAVVLLGLLGKASPLPVVSVPYWREALKLVVDHPAWADFPHNHAPDLQFYSLAPDCVLDATDFKGEIWPIYRRLDMRGMELQEYAVELQWGKGRLIATTLRFAGGLGDQPNNIRFCPAGQYLLAKWVQSLHP